MTRLPTNTLRIMLVDDEPIVLTKIKTMMDYSQYGFEICGETTSGKAAIELLNTLRPDILFTDMRMPAMDGVELVTYLAKNYPHIKVIAISGYEDFQYVYQSLQHGALDYLLKHQLDEERMKQVLQTVRSRLDKELDTHRKESDLRFKFAQADKIVKSEVLRRYLTDEENLTDSQEPFFKESFPSFYLILLEADSLGTQGNADVILADFIEKIFAEYGTCLVIRSGMGQYLAILTITETASEQKHYEMLRHSMLRCQNTALRFLNSTLSCCRSGLLTDISKIKPQYRTLLSAMDTKFYLGSGKILEIPGLKTSHKDFSFPLDFSQPKCWEDAILSYLDDAKESLMPSGKLKSTCREIEKRLLEEGGKWGATQEVLPLSEFTAINSWEEIKSRMTGLLNHYHEALSFQPAPKDWSPKVSEALDYIHRNFTSPISLYTVSQAVELNDAYLSRIFKEETGKGMMEYLKELRIQKAKILLGTSSYRIKSICNMCGFNDYGYFIRAFKAATGKTPVEYRQIKSK